MLGKEQRGWKSVERGRDRIAEVQGRGVTDMRPDHEEHYKPL